MNIISAQLTLAGKKYFTLSLKGLTIARLFLLSILILMAITVTLANANAHPQDTDDLRHIGTGTKLHLLKDINIKPNSYGPTIEKHSELGYREKLLCEFQSYMSSVADYDRVIPAGTIFTIKEIKVQSFASGSTADGGRIYLFIYGLVLNSKNFYLTCRRLDGMTIGEFKYLLDDLAAIQLPAPKIVK